MSENANFPSPRIGERYSYKAWLYRSNEVGQEEYIYITLCSAAARRRISPVCAKRLDFKKGFSGCRQPKRRGIQHGRAITVTAERLIGPASRGRYGGGVVAENLVVESDGRVWLRFPWDAQVQICSEWFNRHFGRRNWENTFVRLWIK